MPNLDKTGPNSAGPMTGRKMGQCAEDTTFIGGRGRGRGAGRGLRNNQQTTSSDTNAEILERLEAIESKLK